MRLKFILVTIVALGAVVSACGGSDDKPAGTGPVYVGGDEETTSGVGVIGAPSLEEVGTPTPSPNALSEVAATPTPVPTPTPPSKTIDEEITGRLVDELSFDEYPRTNARSLEREFRRTPETAEEKIGKSFVVQGDVLEAGNNADNESYVTFKAGLGSVTCIFEVITEAELLRFTPDGTNAVIGTVDTWDAENRSLMLNECRVVLGF